jgi:hypothetical protein
MLMVHEYGPFSFSFFRIYMGSETEEAMRMVVCLGEKAAPAGAERSTPMDDAPILLDSV